MIETLVIINSAFNAMLVLVFVYRIALNKIQFQWRKTFWKDKIVGLDIIIWGEKVGEVPNWSRFVSGTNFGSLVVDRPSTLTTE